MLLVWCLKGEDVRCYERATCKHESKARLGGACTRTQMQQRAYSLATGWTAQCVQSAYGCPDQYGSASILACIFSVIWPRMVTSFSSAIFSATPRNILYLY